jgi:hypothetical protein
LAAATAVNNNHIPQVALRGLDEKGRSVLSTIASGNGPLGYDVLARMLSGTDRLLGSAAELDAVLGELENRGLISWDKTSNRYGVHPIVRAAVLAATADAPLGRTADGGRGDG